MLIGQYICWLCVLFYYYIENYKIPYNLFKQYSIRELLAELKKLKAINIEGNVEKTKNYFKGFWD